MYRYFFIAKNNIKKQKNDMITFFVMILISTMLLFISLSFMAGIGNVIDEVHDITNGTDILFMMADEKVPVEKMEEILRGNPYIGDYELTNALSCLAKYGHKNDKDFSEFSFRFISYDQEFRINKLTIDTRGFHGNEAVLPVSMSTSFKTGDILRVKIEDNVYDLKVAGFTGDAIYCSPMNMGTNIVYVSDDMYNDMLFENSSVSDLEDLMVKATLTKDAKKRHVDGNELCDAIFNEFNDWFTDYSRSHPESKGVFNSVPYSILRGSAMILPMMFIGIVCIFAVVIFVIAMVIIHFSIKNFIMTNMRNTAIMEAAGYTVNELILILISQLSMVVFIASLIGVVIGAMLIGKLGVIIVMTLGLAWNQPVNLSVAIAVVIVLCCLVGALTYIIGQDYNKTSVLEALRGGINAHNFKKNYFPFEKSAFPVAVTLSLKETFGRFKNHIGIIFIMMLLTASLILGMGFSDTFSSNDALMKMVGIDYVDADVYGDELMASALEGMTTVDRFYGESWYALNYTSAKVRDRQVITTRAFTDTSMIDSLIVTDGRMPKHANEMIFATNAAIRMKVGVGDVVTIVAGSKQESYLVTGLCQTINNMGMMAYMTTEGMANMIGNIKAYDYMVYLKDGYDINDFSREFGERYPDVEVADFKENAEGTIGVIKAGVKAVAILIAILTAVIVAFVESLIIKTQITKTWRDLGVSKALGYTSGQLIVQTMMSNMPSVSIGIILGLIVSLLTVDKLVVLAFSIFGFKKTIFWVNPGSYVFVVVLMLSIAMGTAAFIGRRIRTLEPVKMITEE